MKTAALLPTPGDPFLVRHWLRNCELVWRDEVDELRVLVGGQEDPEARAYIREHVERIGGTYTERTAGGTVTHGDALNILITDTDADVVVLLEDDVRVRYPRALQRYLDGIKEGLFHVAASPRGSMSGGLQEAAQRRWPRQAMPEDLGDGHGMWPAFVFAQRACLLDTDRNFGPRAWQPGEIVPGLDYRVEGETEAADTFGGTAFQIRAKYRVHDIPQWKLPWLGDYYLARHNDQMGWFHCGSLSSSFNLGGYEPPPFACGRTLTEWQELGEWAHRLHWWRRCERLHGADLPEHAERYRANWERLRERMGVPVGLIDGWSLTIDQIVTWAEA